MNFSANYSILLWLKMNDLENNHAIISKRNDSGMTGGWELSLDGGTDTFNFRVAFDETFSSVNCALGVNQDRWTHLAIVHQHTDVHFYVNGTLCTTSSDLYGRHTI